MKEPIENIPTERLIAFQSPANGYLNYVKFTV